MKVAILTVVLSDEAADIKEKDLEAAIKIYFNPATIPYCERIDKVKVLSEN